MIAGVCYNQPTDLPAIQQILNVRENIAETENSGCEDIKLP